MSRNPDHCAIEKLGFVLVTYSHKYNSDQKAFNQQQHKQSIFTQMSLIIISKSTKVLFLVFFNALKH